MQREREKKNFPGLMSKFNFAIAIAINLQMHVTKKKKNGFSIERKTKSTIRVASTVAIALWELMRQKHFARHLSIRK